MRRVKDFLRRYWSLLVLVGVWGWVVWKSFEPGTWLLGWDNLVPEWNFGLEFKRLLWGVWQEYRGLGVLGGMAHVADLPRVVILWLLHWVVPTIYLRWMWHLGMLLLGPVGVWWTMRNSKFKMQNSKLMSLLGGLFYLLNPATLQYFYTPYESFSSFYGFFPWLMGLAILYLRTGKRKFLKWFLVMSVLGTSAFYVQTLFVVYVLVLGVWLMVFGLRGIARAADSQTALQSDPKRQARVPFGAEGSGPLEELNPLSRSLSPVCAFARDCSRLGKRIVSLILVVLVANAFWLLPVGYFTWTNSQVTMTNHINSIATPETALMNQAFGGWQDVLGLRGYWLEYGDWKGEKYTRLMDGGWYEWLMKPEVKRVAMGMGVLVVLYLVVSGVVFWIARAADSQTALQSDPKRQARVPFGAEGSGPLEEPNPLSRSLSLSRAFDGTDLILSLGLLGTILLAWLMLGSYNPPFGFIYGWLVKHMPLFGEIFRSVFTKWSVVMAWGMSLGVGGMVNEKFKVKNEKLDVSQNRLSRQAGINSTVMNLILGVLLVGAIGYVMWPVFGQGMIYKRMKVRVPEEYFEMFEFFKHEPVGRVAYFPVQTFWGWDFLRWGYRGSGFLWYGMEQPVLHRSFDVWSPYNEGFYNQISQAIYGCESDGDQLSVISDQGCIEWVGRVLRKYDVEYVLLDRSVIEPGKKEEVLRIPEIEQVMDELGERVFEKGFLTVWRINSDRLSVISDQERVSQAATSGGVTEGSGPFVGVLRNYRVVGGTISPKVGRDVVYEGGEYVEFSGSVPPRQSRGKQAPEAPLISGTDPELTLPEIFYPFAGIGTEEVEMKYVGEENVGWVVIRSKFKPQSASAGPLTGMQNSKLEVTNLILDLGKKQTWPGVVLAKREGGKLKVKVAVGIPGVVVGYKDDGPDLSGSSHPARQRRDDKSGLKSVPNLSSAGGWVKKPEWWEGEVEFEEDKEKIDYVFLGKKWYDVSSLSVSGSVPPRQSRGKQAPEAPLISGTDPEKSWIRVGYFPVELDKTIEVRAARKSGEKQGEVWTKLVGKRKMKMVLVGEKLSEGFSGSVPPRQGRGKQAPEAPLISGTDLGGTIEAWYPVWEGNDLRRRGNQKEAKNCDVLKRGGVETIGFDEFQNRLRNTHSGKPEWVTNLILDSVVYRADGYGVNCDYIPYDRYGGFENYFLIVKGENKTGRSLKIYLHSLEKDQRVILEELLPEGKFEKVYPIEVRNGGGMVLNLETRSFGRVASENVVKQVLLVPAKWGGIRGFEMMSPDLSSSSHPARQRRDDKPDLVSVSGLSKWGTGLYVVRLSGDQVSSFGVQEPILTLSQGYERGWEAIEIQNSNPKALRRGSWWELKIRRLKHVRVNGWKNGWVVPLERDSNLISSPITDHRSLIIVFYWPQLLEWLGLVGLVGVLVWLWRGCV